jgi:hypothetical protein
MSRREGAPGEGKIRDAGGEITKQHASMRSVCDLTENSAFHIPTKYGTQYLYHDIEHILYCNQLLSSHPIVITEHLITVRREYSRIYVIYICSFYIIIHLKFHA